jgi:putative NIF3 family GTP cyclohydrolase 1 type 2
MSDGQRRREFLATLGTASLGYSLSVDASFASAETSEARERTIQEVIDLILAAAGGARREDTVDTVKAGDPSQKITGITTTFLATHEVIRRSIDLGANLVITHEPTFYNHLDKVDWLKGDPIYEAKRKLIEDHKVVVWRFHDYWHLHRPDGVMTGVLKELGWESYADPERKGLCVIPRAPLHKLVTLLKEKLHARTAVLVGDPFSSVSRVGLVLGAAGGTAQIQALERWNLDALVCGEINEWETSEYVRDAIDQGKNKSLVMLGHVNSEEPGMKWLVEWLRPRVPGTQVTHVPAGDPFRFL